MEKSRVGGWTRRAGARTVGGKCAANPSDRDRASEACCGGMIDQYVRRIVHVSVPGCRFPPTVESIERLTRLGVWGAVQVASLLWWRTWRWIRRCMMRLKMAMWRW